MTDTAIRWTKHTWNPLIGCSKEGPECAFCYAETMAIRFGWSKLPWTDRNAAANVQLRPARLRDPHKLKPGARVFVNSMTDLFHAQVPDDYIRQVWDVMCDLPGLTFQVLTKRSERLAAWPGPWPAHIWAGVTCGTPERWDRIEALQRCPAQVRWVSAEPLLAPWLPTADLDGIHQVVVGGESGVHMPRHPARWMPHAWARGIRDLCVQQGVAFFFKQSSATRTEMGQALEHEDGSLWLWEQYPDDRRAPVQVTADDPRYRVPAPPRVILPAS